MDFAQRQRDPRRHAIGISVVILLHALLIYGLVTGLARKAVEVIKKPLTATIVEQIKQPPPPPPPPKRIETPKTPPPEVYVPPPDVPVQAAPSEPVIAAVTSTPTPPPVIAPPAPPPPPPAPAKPAIRRNVVPISKVDPDYPREALKKELEGTVVADLDIDEQGNVTDVRIVSSKPPRIFDQAAKNALMQWKFAPSGEKFIGEIEIGFKLSN